MSINETAFEFFFLLLQLHSVVQFQSLLMGRFKVTGMNWVPRYVSAVKRATIWCQRIRHLELVSQMAREEENGQEKILFANVSLLPLDVTHCFY